MYGLLMMGILKSISATNLKGYQCHENRSPTPG
jgi:hypothetical protein